MRWIMMATVAAALAGMIALPVGFAAGGLAAGGLTMDTAMDIRGTMTGTLAPTGQTWYKFYDAGTRRPLGIVLRFEPYPGTPDNNVSFNVWITQRIGNTTAIENLMVGTATDSGLGSSAGLPPGIKYWRGSADVGRWYYLQLFNNHPDQTVNYSLAGTGEVYPPPTPILAATGPDVNVLPPGTPPVSALLVNSSYGISETIQMGGYTVRTWINRGTSHMLYETIVTINGPGTAPVQVEQVVAINPLSGKDITGSGYPSLVIDTNTGSSHCCSTTQVYELGPTLNKVLDIPAGSCPVQLSDSEGNGIYTGATCDDTFTSVYCPYSSSITPRVFLKYIPGQGYRPANPSFAGQYQTDLQEHLKLLPGVPGARGEFDGTNKCSVLPAVLDYLYSGSPDQAKSVLDQNYTAPDLDSWWLEIRRAAAGSALFVP
jgi:hypothetical protein